jgi:hypothetical protein
LITEKTAGIQGAVATHITAIQQALGDVFQQPQESIPEFSGAAEMAETAGQFEKRSLGHIDQPVYKVTEGVCRRREML